MPDWKKRVTKERAADLLPGETLVAATYFQGRGTLSSLVRYGTARGLGIDVFDQNTGFVELMSGRIRQGAYEAGQEQNVAPEGSLAALFPSDKGIFVVTDRRFIVFGYKQGMFSTKILDVEGSIERTKLQAWTIDLKGMSALLVMQFTDTSIMGIELPKANKPTEFATDVGIPVITSE